MITPGSGQRMGVSTIKKLVVSTPSDWHGYQDTLWGVCHLLGFSLEPRIRDIGEMRLFRMRRRVDQYEHICALFSAPINTRAIRENWDDVLRLLASIYTGVVPASRVLRKLTAYHVESGLYKALREVGRIAKTAFLLKYFTQRQVRRQVQAGRRASIPWPEHCASASAGNSGSAT